MSSISREARLTTAFVLVADTLTAGHDVVAILHTLVTECVEIVGVRAGGLMLVDAHGDLQLMVSTSARADLDEVLQLAGPGPCARCLSTGLAASEPDIAASAGRWPAFSAAALDQGFRSVHATAMRFGSEVIGVMVLLGNEVGELSRRDAAATQALSDVATIGILHERVAAHSQLVSEQLQQALDGRIIIEQAKGVVAQAHGVTMDRAFWELRTYARGHNLKLRAVCEEVARQTLDLRLVSDADFGR